MEFFKTCKTLPIYNFNKIILSGDFIFLVKGYDEFEDEEFKLGVEDLENAVLIFKEIMYEYSILTSNRSIIQDYLSQFKIKELEFKYMITDKILKNFVEFNEIEVLEILKTLRYKFDVEGNIDAQIVEVLKALKRLKTKITILKVNHERKFNNKSKKIEEGIIDNLEEETISLEIALKLSYSIDTKKTSVSKWVSMWKVAGKINKPRN